MSASERRAREGEEAKGSKLSPPFFFVVVEGGKELEKNESFSRVFEAFARSRQCLFRRAGMKACRPRCRAREVMGKRRGDVPEGASKVRCHSTMEEGRRTEANDGVEKNSFAFRASRGALFCRASTNRRAGLCRGGGSVPCACVIETGSWDAAVS